MTTKHGDTLRTTAQSEEQPKPNSSELIERHPVPGSPFHIIKQNEEWFLTMGNYRLSNEMFSMGEVEDYIKEQQWNIILSMMEIQERTYDIRKQMAEELKEIQKEIPQG